MSKKFRVAVTAMALTLGASVFLAACGEKPQPENPGNKPGTTPPQQTESTGNPTFDANGVIRYSADEREEAFGFYRSDEDEPTEVFKDMYKAIEYCAEEGDPGDYVAKLPGEGVADSDVHLFTLVKSDNDQFWYYERGTSLDRYSPWLNDYHSDLGKASMNDLLVRVGTSGLLTYRHGYELVKTSDEGVAVATWNIYPFNDANIQVNFDAYVGITKVEYTIALSEAKLYPVYEGYERAYAKIGFVLPDAHNVANFGLAADTRTGDWYYYFGNAGSECDTDVYNKGEGIMYETNECYLTSTWNDLGYYSPDFDVKLTAEIVGMDDYDYAVDRLTVQLLDPVTHAAYEFEDPLTGEKTDKIVRDYEYSAMTFASTCRFQASLDIYNERGIPYYDCGAQFTNLVVTEAKGYIFQEIIDEYETKYNGHLIPYDAGVYDILNSNEASDVRYQTIVYNKAVTRYNFDTPGRDVYGFSFRFTPNSPAYSSKIRAAKELIASIDTNTPATVTAARAAYNALNDPYQTQFITAEELAKLTSAEN